MHVTQHMKSTFSYVLRTHTTRVCNDHDRMQRFFDAYVRIRWMICRNKIELNDIFARAIDKKTVYRT